MSTANLLAVGWIFIGLVSVYVCGGAVGGGGGCKSSVMRAKPSFLIPTIHQFKISCRGIISGVI